MSKKYLKNQALAHLQMLDGVVTNGTKSYCQHGVEQQKCGIIGQQTYNG
jgi:hypothetical protein